MAKVDFLIRMAVKTVYETGRGKSLVGVKLNNIPDGDIVKYLENELNPEYMNSVFTWKQIVDALQKDV